MTDEEMLQESMDLMSIIMLIAGDCSPDAWTEAISNGKCAKPPIQLMIPSNGWNNLMKHIEGFQGDPSIFLSSFMSYLVFIGFTSYISARRDHLKQLALKLDTIKEALNTADKTIH